MIIIFTRPEYLLLLFAIPLLIFIQIISLKTSKKKAIKFANFEAISRIKGVEIFSKNLTVLYLNILIIILVVFAVSGTSISKQVQASDVAFVVAIDASYSMSATDIQPTRLDAAKQAGIDFLKMIPEQTKIGVVSFSGSPFIEQELQEDKSEARRAIQNIDLKIIGGTDILNAVITSVNLLREEKSKAIILISDGQANVNEIEDIVTYAHKSNVVIHSLGIGTREGSVEESGATFKIAEDTLKTISYETEGLYYHITDSQDFYFSLSEIAGSDLSRKVYDTSLYLMISALILFLISFFLINTRYRTLP